MSHVLWHSRQAGSITFVDIHFSNHSCERIWRQICVHVQCEGQNKSTAIFANDYVSGSALRQMGTTHTQRRLGRPMWRNRLLINVYRLRSTQCSSSSWKICIQVNLFFSLQMLFWLSINHLSAIQIRSTHSQSLSRIHKCSPHRCVCVSVFDLFVIDSVGLGRWSKSNHGKTKYSFSRFPIVDVHKNFP